jgi:hypothetical protein
VTVLTSTSFALASSNPASAGINTSGYGAYTGGGILNQCSPAGSVGIFYENASDYVVSNCTLIGNQIGISGNSSGATDTGLYDGKIVATHVWNYPGMGELLYGFDLWGDTHTIGCQVDAPFEYGFHFRSANNSLVSAEVEYGSAGSFAHHAYPILLDTGAGVQAINCDWKDINSNTPLAAEAKGDLTNYLSFANTGTNLLQYGPRGPNAVNTWAYCAAGSSPSILAASNVGIITRKAAGDYELSLNNALNANASITVKAATTSGVPIVAAENLGSRGAYTIRVVFYNLSGTLTDPTTFSVQVVQQLTTAY